MPHIQYGISSDRFINLVALFDAVHTSVLHARCVVRFRTPERGTRVSYIPLQPPPVARCAFASTLRPTRRSHRMHTRITTCGALRCPSCVLEKSYGARCWPYISSVYYCSSPRKKRPRIHTAARPSCHSFCTARKF